MTHLPRRLRQQLDYRRWWGDRVDVNESGYQITLGSLRLDLLKFGESKLSGTLVIDGDDWTNNIEPVHNAQSLADAWEAAWMTKKVRRHYGVSDNEFERRQEEEAGS